MKYFQIESFRCYDPRRIKKVPDAIVTAPAARRMAFWQGYYAGDGLKAVGKRMRRTEGEPTGRDKIRCVNKGKIGAASLFFLMRSLGYGVSVGVGNRNHTLVLLTGNRSLPHGRHHFEKDVVKKVHAVPTDPSASHVYQLILDGASCFIGGVGCLLIPSAAPRRSAGNNKNKRSRPSPSDSVVV